MMHRANRPSCARFAAPGRLLRHFLRDAACAVVAFRAQWRTFFVIATAAAMGCNSSGRSSGRAELVGGFGGALAPLGDLDGDGNPDIAVGVPGNNDSAKDQGGVDVLFLRPDATYPTPDRIESKGGGFTGDLDSFDYFGSSVVNLGDLDGDGVLDLAVGAREDDDGPGSSGAVWILFLNPTGTVKSFQKISSLEGGFTGVLDKKDRFGSALAALDDLDGDGVVDIAVGAPFDDDGASAQGAVWILFLNTNGTPKSSRKISMLEGGFLGPLRHDDHFGAALGSPGDLDGDGVTDLLVGEPFDDDPEFNAGAFWILNLNSDGTVKAQKKINAEEPGFTAKLKTQDEFGSAIAAIADLDADGIPELASGAPGSDENFDRGALYIIFLASGGMVSHHVRIDSDEGGFTGKIEPLDHFGAAVTDLGDLDKDGVHDLAVGATGGGTESSNQGLVWILYLNADGTVKTQAKAKVEKS